jgi:hypothetical protein
MSTKLTKNLILFLIILSHLFGDSHGNGSVRINSSADAQPEEASITFSDRDRNTIIIKFDEEDLRRVERSPEYIYSKFQAAGVQCCEPRKKISDCIWRCCDGNQVRTCNPTLKKALDQLWGEN